MMFGAPAPLPLLPSVGIRSDPLPLPPPSGAPSHRLEAQMQATARVLEINCQMVYIPGVMLVSFGDPTTHTSETKVRPPPRLAVGALAHGANPLCNPSSS